MTNDIKIKKGLDLHLTGAVTNTTSIQPKKVSTVAVIPDDFQGLTPKMEVREGDAVLCGQPLFHHKTCEAIKVVSPAAGTVKAIVRGERRKILRVEVAVAGNVSFKHSTEGVLTDAAKAKALLCASGLWAMMTQRPYAIVPDANATIRDVFVSCFDSAPLAVNQTTFTADEQKRLQAAITLLKLLTTGSVYVGRRANQQLPALNGATIITINGPHPAGNVGTLIGNTAPVNKGETVLCVTLPTLLRIGAVALTGILPTTTTVALTGSEVAEPKMIQTVMGAEIAPLLDGELKGANHHIRIISGNVLTGKAVAADGFMHLPYSQITVIPEGDDVDEFMGWASMSAKKMSVSRSFPSHLFGKRLFSPDARLLGGRRAMIMSGEYDKVMPFDILPEYLLKAILSHDIDRMEQLGIYEVAPEDFALAEYVDTSKLELQKIVRDGLDYLRKELE